MPSSGQMTKKKVWIENHYQLLYEECWLTLCHAQSNTGPSCVCCPRQLTWELCFWISQHFTCSWPTPKKKKKEKKNVSTWWCRAAASTSNRNQVRQHTVPSQELPIRWSDWGLNSMWLIQSDGPCGNSISFKGFVVAVTAAPVVPVVPKGLEAGLLLANIFD